MQGLDAKICQNGKFTKFSCRKIFIFYSIYADMQGVGTQWPRSKSRVVGHSPIGSKMLNIAGIHTSRPGQAKRRDRFLLPDVSGSGYSLWHIHLHSGE